MRLKMRKKASLKTAFKHYFTENLDKIRITMKLSTLRLFKTNQEALKKFKKRIYY